MILLLQLVLIFHTDTEISFNLSNTYVVLSFKKCYTFENEKKDNALSDYNLKALEHGRSKNLVVVESCIFII